jgi:hypothetical protein
MTRRRRRDSLPLALMITSKVIGIIYMVIFVFLFYPVLCTGYCSLCNKSAFLRGNVSPMRS